MLPEALVFWFASVILMALIFALSSRPSDLTLSDSGIFSRAILRILNAIGIGGITEADPTLTLMVRKAGHVLAYAALALLLYRAASRTPIFIGIGRKNMAFILHFSFAATLAFAISDEVHQGFVAGRAMRLSDVGIDAMAAIAALSAVTICEYRARR